MIWLIFLLFLNQEGSAETLLKEAQEIIEKNTVRNYTKNQLEEAALKGMASSLDPYSNYLNPQEAKNWYQKLSGEFYGIGIDITKAKEGALIMAIYEEGPAEKAGLKPGDLIIAIEGEKLFNKELDIIRNLIIGPKFSSVNIKIIREGEKKSFSIKRNLVKIKPQVKKFNNTLYIKIKTFNKGLVKEIEKILQENNYQSVIIDLRSNPGGLLDESLGLAELFLPKNKVLVIVKEKNKSEKIFSKKQDLLNGKELVVLVNGFSASGSELFAAAVQDHKRAILIGSKTFGKGSLQSPITLSKGLLKITIGFYLSPLGRTIEGLGLEPDLLVTEDDKVIERALDLLVLQNFYLNKGGVLPPG
jgi:carboxyl-terminal processing protease